MQDAAYRPADTASHEPMQVGEVDMDEDPYEEEDPFYQEDRLSPRRAQATVIMIIGTVVFLLSLVVLAGHMTDGTLRELFSFISFTTWIWVFFAALAVLLVWLLVLIGTTPGHQEEEWLGEEEGVEETQEDRLPLAEPGEPGAPDTISLRCPRCMNIFSLQDPGERPFHHECPHCEVRGVYSGP